MHWGLFRRGGGPEVVEAALTVLRAVESLSSSPRFEVRMGGRIGNQAICEYGRPLSEEACQFCEEIFAQGGAILAGAGGDRFVYDARRRFELYCKLNPLIPPSVPLRAGRIRPEYTAGVDIMVVRENMGGVYQGAWGEHRTAGDGRIASQRFEYTERQIRQIVDVAVRLANDRRGELAVVVKPNGVPTISQLWIDCAREIAASHSIRLRELEIDYATFHMIQDPHRFDVVVTSNLFGDILSDVGGLLLGSRGLCYGGSFSASGAAIYQTNHGAALDLAGTDRANPVGQIHSLAMLLRDSFGMAREAENIHRAVESVWRSGVRTDDLREPGCRLVGTQEMGRLVAAAVSDSSEGEG